LTFDPSDLDFVSICSYYNTRIQDRIKQFVAEIEKQASDIQASENPDLIEMMPKLLKVNFKPMDDIWRAIGKIKSGASS